MRRLLSVVAGLGLTLAGVVGVLLSVVAMLHPAGAKIANDVDPFGGPPTIMAAMLTLLVCLAMAAAGVWLSRRGKERR
jgi:hypothetical protein